MNRRDFFRGVGAAAIAVSLEPVPTSLLPMVIGIDPAGSGHTLTWVIYRGLGDQPELVRFGHFDIPLLSGEPLDVFGDGSEGELFKL